MLDLAPIVEGGEAARALANSLDGRAPGTDPATTRALGRSLASDVDRFPEAVLELIPSEVRASLG